MKMMNFENYFIFEIEYFLVDFKKGIEQFLLKMNLFEINSK